MNLKHHRQVMTLLKAESIYSKVVRLLKTESMHHSKAMAFPKMEARHHQELVQKIRRRQ